MKLLLLHGAGISSSRTKLIDLRDGFDPNHVMVFGEGVYLEDINNNLAAIPLFASDRLIILENPSEDFTNYQLPASPVEPTTNYQIILWFDHEVLEKKPIYQWVKLQKGQILYFPEAKEVSVFPLLDLLVDKNKDAYLEIKKLKKAGFEIQYFITMIFYLLRTLIYLPKNAHPFVQKKVSKQRMNFSKYEIISLYKFVLETDFKIKKGLMEPQQAEFNLVNRFIFKKA